MSLVETELLQRNLTGCHEQAGEKGPDTWWIGLLLSLIASLCANVGVQLQRYSMLKERKRKANSIRPYFRQPTWQLGFLVTTVTALGDFAAMGFAPQSLVTAIGASTLVSNALLGYFWMKEPLSKKDSFATFLIVLGIVFVCLFAPRGKQCFSLDDLIRLYGEPAFIAYAVTAGSLILVMFAMVKVLESKKRKVVASAWQRSFKNRLLSFCYTALSGCIGAQSVLFAKSTAELLKNTIMGDMQLDKVGSWVIVSGMVFAIVSQVHWMARALQNADNIFVQPIFQSCFIGISSIGGLLYFQEIKELNETQTLFFALAMMLVLVGIVMLAGRQMPKNPKQRFRAAVHASIAITRMKKSVLMRMLEESTGNELTSVPMSGMLVPKLPSQAHPKPSPVDDWNAAKVSAGDMTLPVHQVVKLTGKVIAQRRNSGFKSRVHKKAQVFPVDVVSSETESMYNEGANRAIVAHGTVLNTPQLSQCDPHNIHQNTRAGSPQPNVASQSRTISEAAQCAVQNHQYQDYASLIYKQIAMDSEAILRDLEKGQVNCNIHTLAKQPARATTTVPRLEIPGSTVAVFDADQRRGRRHREHKRRKGDRKHSRKRRGKSSEKRSKSKKSHKDKNKDRKRTDNS